MADQKWLLYTMFYFQSNNYPIWPNKLAIFKLALWNNLATFPHNHGSFALSVYVFKSIHQKMKSLNAYEK